MKTIRITPNRLQVERLVENDHYITNGFWLVDKTQVPDTFDTLRAQHEKVHSAYPGNNSPTKEVYQTIINKAQDGELKKLTEISTEIPYTDFEINGTTTRLNVYFVEFMKKLGATHFEQSITIKYSPVIAKRDTDLIGLIMPIAI